MKNTLGAVLWLVLPALLPGCSEQPAPQLRQRGLVPGEEAARTPVPTLVPAPQPVPQRASPSALTSPFAKPSDPGALARTQAQALPAEPASEDAGQRNLAADSQLTPTEATTPRDLSSELIAMLGQPANCLDLAAVASAGGRTTISLTVSVMPSGRIIRASASAPNQAADALRCLEQKASAGNFRSPVPNAPRDVTATIPIEVVAQPEAR